MNKEHDADLFKALLNLVEAIEGGITAEILLKCSKNENSYLFQAREAIRRANEQRGNP